MYAASCVFTIGYFEAALVDTRGEHFEGEFVWVAVAGFFGEEFEFALFLAVVGGAEFVVLCTVSMLCGIWGLWGLRGGNGLSGEGWGVVVIYLALLQETPFLALFGLRALFVVAPLDGVAHRRHSGRVWVVCLGVVRCGGAIVESCRCSYGNFGKRLIDKEAALA
jgi:hypothetical protein